MKKLLKERYKDGDSLGVEVRVSIPGKESFIAKKKYRRQRLLRLGDKIDTLLDKASEQLDKSVNQLEIEFHERFLITFLNEKGLEIIRGEVFSK